MVTCRACLCTNGNLVEVDSIFISNYNSLTNLQVGPFDGLPECFCRSCVEAVNFFIEFKRKCISSESILRERGPYCKHPEFSQQPDVDFEHEIDIKCELKEDTTDPFLYEIEDYHTRIEVQVKKEDVTAVDNNPNKEETELCDVQVGKRKKKFNGKKRGKRALLSVVANKPKAVYKVCDEHYCGLCDESFIVLDLLNKHLDTHRTDKKCSICSKEFENWPKLLAHRVMHSGKKNCHLCPKRFHSLNTLEHHYLNFHYEERIAEMSCLYCPKKFTCPQKFSIHVDTHNIECHVCSEIFTTRRLLNFHLRTHEPKNRFQCDMCEYTAVYAQVLEHHKKRKHKKFSCNICDRKFADSTRLKDHICKDKSKLCPICGQRIYDSFTRHLSSHTDAKPYKCDRCPATYKNRLSLKTHLDRHDGNRNFVCDYCDRKFFAASTLNKHRRVHTGEKPYECEKCGKRFTGSSNRKIHMQTHGIMLINKRVRPDPPAPPATNPDSNSAQTNTKEVNK